MDDGGLIWEQLKASTHSPEPDVRVKAHLPEFPAAAARTRRVVAEHVDHVVETSREDVHAAELVPDRLEDLQVETREGRTEGGGQRCSAYLGEDGGVVVF